MKVNILIFKSLDNRIFMSVNFFHNMSKKSIFYCHLFYLGMQHESLWILCPCAFLLYRYWLSL